MGAESCYTPKSLKPQVWMNLPQEKASGEWEKDQQKFSGCAHMKKKTLEGEEELVRECLWSQGEWGVVSRGLCGKETKKVLGW